MGTHPIFESDFDCLTVFNRVIEERNRENKSMPPKRRASAGTAHAHLAKVLTSPELNSIKNQKVQQKLEAALSKGSKITSPVAAVAAADHGDDQLKVKIQKLEAELDARNHEFEKKQAEVNAQLHENRNRHAPTPSGANHLVGAEQGWRCEHVESGKGTHERRKKRARSSAEAEERRDRVIDRIVR